MGSDYIPATQTYFSGVNGMAWDPIAQRLLISDQNRVRQIFFTPPTATALSTAQNPAPISSVVSLQATVSPATATGSVGFLTGYNGGNYATFIGSAPLVNGVATFSWTAPPSPGTTFLTAVYLGDAADNLSLSPTLSETVQQSVTTTTTQSSSLNPSNPGQSVTFTATVTPSAATGTVTFNNGGASIGSATLQNGVATLTTTTLPSGQNSIQAVYAGAGGYAGSSSAVLTQTVNVATTTSLVSSANPITLGGSTTFTATVNPTAATGTVQFTVYNSGNLMSSVTVPLASGVAAWNATNLSSGANTVTAIYSGDGTHAGSTSAPLTEMVRFTSYAALSTSPNPSTPGAAVVLTGQVYLANGGQTGSIQFFNGATLLGTANLSASGQAQITVTSLPVGTDSLTASYSGDTYWAPSTSSAVQQVVSKASTSTALSSSPNPSISGSAVSLTATVTPSSATGSVQFFNGSTLLGAASLTGGVAQLSTASLPVGTDSLTAVYSGDSNYTGSSSGVVQQTVEISTTISLTNSPSTITFGANVTLTATVSPSGATGTVQFFDGGNLIGTASLSSGQARLTTSSLPAGANSLTAVYSGDATHSASTSSARTETVNKANSNTSLSASPNSSTPGETVTFTATVTPSAATGTVQFLNGGTVMGTATLSGGVAVFSTSSLSTGTHQIKAEYSGDSNVNSSQSSTRNYRVK